MAKALLVLALWVCIPLSAALAAAPKKPPTWAELKPEQQQILAPLAYEWDHHDPARKRKWLGNAKRYPKMKPDAQARAQKRMQAWVRLTPAERRAARERYKKLESLPADKRQALRQEWEEYNRLPEQERRKLGAAQRRSPAAAVAPAPGISAPPPGPVPLAAPGAPAAAASN